LVPFQDNGSHYFEWILKMVDVGIHLVDRNGITVFYNDKMAEIDGLDRMQVIGKSIFHLYPSLTHETSTLVQVLQTGKAIPDTIQTYFNVAGKRITTANSTYPLIENDLIVGALEVAKDITGIAQLHDQILDLRHQLYQSRQKEKNSSGSAHYHFSDLIGGSEPFLNALSIAKRAARTQSPVFICGPTGTGKELVAQSIHNAGMRRGKPFIAQNCAAFPGELMEGLLFGTARGAFTGAIDRAGLFEQANGGTLFLDELNSLDVYLQAKLLRVLQDGIVRRIGGTSEQQVNVRIIAAMNIEPQDALDKGILRYDLFYRLNVVNIYFPPLLQRMEDVPLLVRHFIETFNPLFDMHVANISQEAMHLLMRYSWPGNIRELKHAIESSYNMLDLDAETIDAEHLPAYLKQHLKSEQPHAAVTPAFKPEAHQPVVARNLEAMLDQIEREAIADAMRQHRNNVSLAAESLGIKRQALQYKLKRHGLSRN